MLLLFFKASVAWSAVQLSDAGVLRLQLEHVLFFTLNILAVYASSKIQEHAQQKKPFHGYLMFA